METLERTSAGHVDTLIVTKNAEGWEVRETHDRTVIRTQQYRDWHRVERAMQVFDLQGVGAHRPL